MEIRWLGHSCFRLSNSNGTAVVTDPFDETVGYRMPDVKADVVLISHEHFDHNNVAAVRGRPVVIKKPGKHQCASLEVIGVSTYHDMKKGKLRGINVIFSFVMDGIRVCHLGDLGHPLDRRQIEEIGEVDLLLIPVGRQVTLELDDIDEIIDKLKAKVVVPMHYKTLALSFDLEDAEDFLKGKHVEGPLKSLDLGLEDLPASDAVGVRVVLLDYAEDR